MSIISSFIARLNNSKRNLFNPNKKDKISSLEIDIIMNNIIKAKKNNNFNFLNNKNNFRRGNKREKKFYNKRNDNENGKVQVAKLNKYYKKRKIFKS